MSWWILAGAIGTLVGFIVAVIWMASVIGYTQAKGLSLHLTMEDLEPFDFVVGYIGEKRRVILWMKESPQNKMTKIDLEDYK